VKYCVYIIIVLIQTLISGCTDDRIKHELKLSDNELPDSHFVFHGGLADSFGEWVYHVNIEYDDLEFPMNLTLYSNDKWSCPLGMKVIVDKQVKYGLSEGSEETYTKNQSDKCVKYYLKLIYQEIKRKQLSIDSYSETK